MDGKWQTRVRAFAPADVAVFCRLAGYCEGFGRPEWFLRQRSLALIEPGDVMGAFRLSRVSTTEIGIILLNPTAHASSSIFSHFFIFRCP